MDDSFDENQPRISLLVSNLLERLGICDRIRGLRKRLWQEVEELTTFSSGPRKVFGSQIEGSTTSGLYSDVDLVMLNSKRRALTKLHQTFAAEVNFLMVSDMHTFPGYFKLQRLYSINGVLTPLFKEDIKTNSQLSVDLEGRIVANADAFILQPMQRDLYTERHEPASSMGEKLWNYDIINGVRIHNWDGTTAEWLRQHAKYAWATINDLERICREETFLVPVGHNLSPETTVEWRISFSEVERRMMWGFNNTQMSCYVLMKMINKEFIEPNTGKCLTSYQAKTALFYLLNVTEESLWRPDKLIHCLHLLMRTIVAMARAGNCPNYFIRDENMFLGKMTGVQRDCLCRVLDRLINDRQRSYLLRIKCDQLGTTLSNACNRLVSLDAMPTYVSVIHIATQDTNSPSFLGNTVLHTLVFMHGVYHRILRDHCPYISRGNMLNLIRAYKTGSQHLRAGITVVSAFLSSHIGCQIASACVESQTLDAERLRLALEYLVVGARSDTTAGPLKLATYLVKLGYFNSAEIYLKHIGKHLGGCRMGNGFIIEFGSLNDSILQQIVPANMTTAKISQRCTEIDVIYLPSEIHITLPPICNEFMNRETVSADPEELWNSVHIAIHGRCYLYFLQYQTCRSLGNLDHKFRALYNLAVSFKSCSNSLCLKMLEFCRRQEEMTQ